MGRRASLLDPDPPRNHSRQPIRTGMSIAEPLLMRAKIGWQLKDGVFSMELERSLLGADVVTLVQR